MQHLFVLALEVDRKDYDDFFWSDSYFINWTRRVTHVTDDKTGLVLGLSYVMTGVKKNGIVTQIFSNV